MTTRTGVAASTKEDLGADPEAEKRDDAEAVLVVVTEEVDEEVGAGTGDNNDNGETMTHPRRNGKPFGTFPRKVTETLLPSSLKLYGHQVKLKCPLRCRVVLFLPPLYHKVRR